MKCSFSWLKDFLETEADPTTLCEAFNRIGIELESFYNPADLLRDLKIARIVAVEKHPAADRLHVLRVDLGGDRPLEQVVCGASNVREGLLSVFAGPGTYVPGLGLTVSVGTIRGVTSHGMLLSEKEMGFSDAHEGIIELPEGASPGDSFVSYADLDDPVFDLAITPNRGDCLSVRGLARELAAAGLGRLRGMTREEEDSFLTQETCPVLPVFDFGDQKPVCLGFAMRLIRGVRNGPSPAWMQKRLQAVGLRPINALVDITNYVTHSEGRPLHVFDAQKVVGPLKIGFAGTPTPFLALDGKSYLLEGDMCVLRDAQGIQSLAGIIGGAATGCTMDTEDVLIESALWDPVSIAQTGRRLGLVSEARHRFERGVDPQTLLPGLNYATRLILEFCGGTATELVQYGDPIVKKKQIVFPLSEIKRLSGIAFPEDKVIHLMEGLGCQVMGGGRVIHVTPPSWRSDLHEKTDLVEEVLRLSGIDEITEVALPQEGTVQEKHILNHEQIQRIIARRAFVARGFCEAITWSFISQTQAGFFGGGNPSLNLANPISPDLSEMRPHLLPGLLSAVQHNANRGFRDVALFEVGQIFLGDQPQDQRYRAAAVRYGLSSFAGAGRHWSEPGQETVSVFEIKADVLAVLEELGLPMDRLQLRQGGAPAWYHPGRSGTLQQGPKTLLAHFGALHPEVCTFFGLEGVVLACEIYLDAHPKSRLKTNKGPLLLSDLMPVRRDFSFIIQENAAAEGVLRAVRSADKSLIQGVTLFDCYRGKGIPEGHKALGIEVQLQPIKKTLTEQEIEAVSQKIVLSVQKATGAVLRHETS